MGNEKLFFEKTDGKVVLNLFFGMISPFCFSRRPVAIRLALPQCLLTVLSLYDLFSAA